MCIKFCFCNKTSATEMCKMLQKAFTDNYFQIEEYFNCIKFKEVRYANVDELHSSKHPF